MIKTRFAPSPTGVMHLGNVRTALFNWLFAKSVGGKFLLRIEDTDLERSKNEHTLQIQEDLSWLGLSWDEGPYFQSERLDIYEKYYDELIEKDIAYPCFCSENQLKLMRKVQLSSNQPPRYTGKCRSLTKAEIEAKIASGEKPTLRFKVPEGVTEFNDIVHGHQCFNNQDIGDFIIRRANGMTTFMYCNVIDDALMNVTHAFRGEDHLTNTPRQIMIAKALGLTPPAYGHITLIVGEDGSPLSKRHGSRSVKDLREMGYLPKTINNYLSRLGHYYADNELMSLDRLSENFHPDNLNRSAARFDVIQLKHWQKEALTNLESTQTAKWVGDIPSVPDEKQAAFIDLVKPNILFPNEALHWAAILFETKLTYSKDAQAIIDQAGNAYFACAMDAFITHGKDAKAITNQLKEKLSIKGKALFMPLRAALTGELHGPELAAILALMPDEIIKTRLSGL